MEAQLDETMTGCEANKTPASVLEEAPGGGGSNVSSAQANDRAPGWFR